MKTKSFIISIALLIIAINLYAQNIETGDSYKYPCIVDTLFTGEIVTNYNILTITENSVYNIAFSNIKEIFIDWEYEIKTSTDLAGAKIDKNGNIVGASSPTKIYGFKIKGMKISTFDGIIHNFTNIKSCAPDILVFKALIDGHSLSISFPITNFEVNENEFETEADANRFFMSKPISFDKTIWRAQISKIQFIKN